MKCKICNKILKNNKSLVLHLRSHDISSKEYYDLYLKYENEEKCNKLECNNNVKYINIKEGYGKYCSCKCRSNTTFFKNMIKRNHTGKISYLKGKTYTEVFGEKKALELKEQKSILHKNKILSITTKEKIAETRKNKGHGIGSKNGMWNKTHDEKVKNKQRNYMLSGGSSHARSFLKRISKPQLELYNLVCSIAPYVILEYPCLNKSIDIAIPSLSIAIEYDDLYWHQNRQNDLERQYLLQKEGWKFIRYINHIPSKKTLLKDINDCLKTDMRD